MHTEAPFPNIVEEQFVRCLLSEVMQLLPMCIYLLLCYENIYDLTQSKMCSGISKAIKNPLLILRHLGI